MATNLNQTKDITVNQSNSILKLSHNTQIRVKGFRYEPEIIVGTIAGYAIENKECPVEAIARATKFGHSLNPWVLKSASVLTSNYPGKDKDHADAHARFIASPEVEHGQIVEIEGKQFTVRIVGEQYSDPIHFVPTPGTEGAK